ncbi:MAG: tripartite tricarboxylate transporter permease [Candidatus Accumulibacter sp.]|jgi:putative tricarboxylic transport membrane protein|nr:tripartite tricarboxylate transporter permease [Accumulibacter sp.]
MESILSNLLLGFQNAMTLTNLLWVTIGSFLGTLFGMLPGIGPATGIAILIPLSYGMDPTTALITMCAIYYGAMFGGSIASIMINTPGDASAIVTCWDGYRMAQKGFAGKALATSAISSFVGGMIACVMVVLLAQAAASVALSFGPAEMFALILFAMTAVVTLAEGKLLRGAVALLIGVMISTVGIDGQSGIFRFTLGIDMLQDGIEFLVAIIGCYAIAEVFNGYAELDIVHEIDVKKIGRVMISKEDWKKIWLPIVRSTPISFFLGCLPGVGGSMTSLIAYTTERQLAKNPEGWGHGDIVGVAAPEAANNASSTASIIPMLAIGIPSSGTTAVMLGALMMLGVQPGPMLFEQHPEIAWGVIASMFIGNIVLVFLNMPMVPYIAKLLALPQKLLIPIIVCLAFMGTYMMNYSTFDFYLLVVFGCLGYVMQKLDIPIPPMVLALILGDTMEKTLRQALVATDGNPVVFLDKPIALVFFGLAALSLCYSLYQNKKMGQKRKAAEQAKAAV